MTTRAYLRAIAEAFAGPVLQLYGASEVGVMFMEDGDGRLQHCPFTTHVELFPARVPTPGADDVALAVVTTLDRVAMPLVRFVVGDLVQRRLDGERAAGRASPRCTGSRAASTTRSCARTGRSSPPGRWIARSARVDGLFLWQAHQRAADRVEVDVVADGDAARSRTSWPRCRPRLSPLLAGLDVAARSVTAIPIEPSGKFRVSKRHFPLDLGRVFGPDLRRRGRSRAA